MSEPMLHPSAEAYRQAERAQKWRKRRGEYHSALLGMLSEILFSLGLILIGFIISLLCGW